MQTLRTGRVHVFRRYLAAQAGIECHLRREFSPESSEKSGFYQLIENSPILPELETRVHLLHLFRNRLVQVNEPGDDEDLVAGPECHEEVLEDNAAGAIRLLWEVIT